LGQAPGHFVPLRMDVPIATLPEAKPLRELVYSRCDGYIKKQPSSELELVDQYTDSLPLLGLRKACMRLQR
jgi:hypothetical protein